MCKAPEPDGDDDDDDDDDSIPMTIVRLRARHALGDRPSASIISNLDVKQSHSSASAPKAKLPYGEQQIRPIRWKV